jgi:hypothetical protein
MKRKGNTTAKIGMVCAVVAALSAGCKTYSASKLTGPEAQQLAVDAYIYGYPLVTMEMTRRVVTNVREPEGSRAPMGHLIRMRAYPTAAYRDVTAPNADTLYTTTFFDVGAEPWVLNLPDSNDRYYLMPMLDGWTDVFEVPGKRTTGSGPQKYAITGPRWKGTLPAGVKELNRQQQLFGCWAASIAAGHRRITRRPTRCRTRYRSFRSALTAVPTPRLPVMSTRLLT